MLEHDPADPVCSRFLTLFRPSCTAYAGDLDVNIFFLQPDKGGLV